MQGAVGGRRAPRWARSPRSSPRAVRDVAGALGDLGHRGLRAARRRPQARPSASGLSPAPLAALSRRTSRSRPSAPSPAGRAARSQANGPSAANSQRPRHGSDPRRPAPRPGAPGRRVSAMPGCQVPPLNGVRSVARETSVNRAAGDRPRSRVADHSVRVSGPVRTRLEVEVAQPLGDGPQLTAAGDRGGGVDPDVGDAGLPLDRPGDQQLGVGQRAGLLVGDEGGAVEPARSQRVDVGAQPEQRERTSGRASATGPRGRPPGGAAQPDSSRGLSRRRGRRGGRARWRAARRRSRTRGGSRRRPAAARPATPG